MGRGWNLKLPRGLGDQSCAATGAGFQKQKRSGASSCVQMTIGRGPLRSHTGAHLFSRVSAAAAVQPNNAHRGSPGGLPHTACRKICGLTGCIVHECVLGTEHSLPLFPTDFLGASCLILDPADRLPSATLVGGRRQLRFLAVVGRSALILPFPLQTT